MSETKPFWVDREYDRDQSSDGISRYGSYVRSGNFDPWTDDFRSIELAAYAWQRATGPVMAPGYVRRKPRISHVSLARSDWDGRLLADVGIIVPQPEPFWYLPCAGDRGFWQDWPTEYGFSGDTWHLPGGDDLARLPYLMTTVNLQFALTGKNSRRLLVSLAEIPSVPGDDAPAFTPSQLIEACVTTVDMLVAELNFVVGPVLAKIEGA